jgi:uroporphyrinogen decarboxylase
MNSIERVICTLEGGTPDRIPTFSAGIEDRTYNDVLGDPLITQHQVFRNPVTEFVMNHWGPGLTKPVFQRVMNTRMEKRIKAAVLLGFDATWGLYEESFVFLDSKTMARFSGSLFNIVDDGFGNVSYQYKGPGITSREEFEAWPYWPDAGQVAKRAYTFYRKMVRKYGDKICFFGQASGYGIFESLLWAIGMNRLPLWIRKEEDLVLEYIRRMEEICLKTAVAMLDAGVPVVIQSDDFAFKTGPFLNPKLIDRLFGPSYRRIIHEVHERGGKFILHSCGDNTLLFDMFIDWGVDGLHAYENTSNVDIFEEKKRHGEQTVMIGGVGIDYLLSDRSKDEEVVEHVKKMINELGPGGHFIMAPVHSMSSIPAHKLEVMIDTVKEYGNYPITPH